MDDLIKQVESNIAVRELIPDHQHILVAVSGGVDSMVLFYVLRALALQNRWKLTAAHFNHQLRGRAANRDEALVKTIARRWKIPFVSGRADVCRAAKESGASVEMAARRLRHEFLAKTARIRKASFIALGHHADDQVETLFLRVLRGAGGEGFGGMRWQNKSHVDPSLRLVRPLFDLTKADLLQFAASHKIPFAEDASNQSKDHLRNFIRHELLPGIDKRFPGSRSAILRTMDLVGAEADFVRGAALKWLEGGRGRGFAESPVALQRRILYQQLLQIPIAPNFELVERLRLRPGLWFTAGVDHAVRCSESGKIAVRSGELMPNVFKRRKVCLSNKRETVELGAVKITWKVTDDNGTARAFEASNAELFDADKVGAHIVLRHWHPGDRFQPIGMKAPVKLQNLFVNAKVPRRERHQRVVAATAAGEIFWVEGLRMAEKFKLDGHTTRRLAWSWSRILPQRLAIAEQG